MTFSKRERVIMTFSKGERGKPSDILKGGREVSLMTF